jgi:hypothetical protein
MTPARRREVPGACHLVAREVKREGARTTIEIAVPGRKPFRLRPSLGAGLGGLAIP